jgi:hypothetical protein
MKRLLWILIYLVSSLPAQAQGTLSTDDTEPAQAEASLSGIVTDPRTKDEPAERQEGDFDSSSDYDPILIRPGEATPTPLPEQSPPERSP